jgi:uncharacterized membrane protein YfcA
MAGLRPGHFDSEISVTKIKAGDLMDLFHVVALLIAGVIGGTISTVIGGASIITFPVLLATGIPPVTAVVSNTVALVPGNLVATIYDRAQLPPLGRSFVRLVAASVSGALMGAVLLLLTPERAFEILVPLLLGFATVLFAYSPRIAAWMRSNSPVEAEPKVHRWSESLTALLPVSIYGGYFGAGVGVLVLGVLSIGTGGDYRSANVLKNLVVFLNSLMASLFFAASGSVAWPQALTMMAGVLVGAILGARIAQVLPNDWARGMVIILGFVLTVIYAWRYWF